MSSILGKLVNFIITVILARLLDPSDFGLVAIALVIVNFLEIVRDLGVGSALIHRKENNDIVANTAFFLFPAVAVVIYLIAYLIAPLASDFFREEKLISVIRVLSVTFIIWSFGNLPRALLSKELKFKRLMISDILARIGNGAVAILMALQGFGVWSLVGGRLFYEIVALITIWLVLDWRPSIRFDLKIAVELLSYGKHIIIASIMVFLISVVDTITVGRELGSEILGYYNIAFNIAVLVTVQNAIMFSKVLFPAYSLIQEDIDKMRKAYIKTLTYLSIIIFPAAFGMISVAWFFIKVVYGDKWLPAVVALQILCIGELGAAIQNTTENVYLAAGKPRMQAKVNFLKLIAILILIYPLTLKYGIIGTAISIAVPSILILLIVFNEAGKIIGESALSIIKAVFPATLGSLAMASIVLFVQQFIFFQSTLLTLFSLVFIGLTLYLVILRFTHEEIFEDVRNIFLKIKSRLFTMQT